MADCNRTDNTELTTPQQETDPDINGISASDRRLGALAVGTLVSQSRQKKRPEPFSKLEEERYEPYEVRAGASGSYPQKESQIVVGSLNSKIDALNKELDELHLQNEVKHLKGELAATERQAKHAERRADHAEQRADRAEQRADRAEQRADRAEQRADHAEQRADHAERQLKQQEKNYQIERSASTNKLRERVNELQSELDDAQELEKCIKEETQEKIAALQIRVNELEPEKEATSPILQLKLFCKDVKPTGKKLGSGCYGSVIEVKYNDVIYAAKKFRGDLEIRNFEEKLNMEFGILLQLEHDHIVRYIGFTILQDSEFPVLIMEKLATSLHAHLECEHAIPLAKKMYILLGVGKGLRYLHEKGVFHRDLTARNVLLDQSNPPFPKIADFGNSHITSTNPIYERDSSVLYFPGTLFYMPPEACKKDGRHSNKLDVFSFGHLSLFVCTQTFPNDLLDSTYTIDREDGTEKIRGRSEVDRRKKYFAELYEEQYSPLKALMYKCLANNPAKRPSASEVICELNEIHAHLEPSDNFDFRDDYDMPLQETHDSIPDIN